MTRLDNKLTDKTIALILTLITLIVYTLTQKGTLAHLNYFVPLANAFLHGRLYVIHHPAWLNELILWKGHYYVVYPPMPAVLLMPFVAFFGANFYQPALSILIGGVNVGLAYLVFRRLFERKISVWLSLLYAFGTMQWFHAIGGSAWYIAHIIALFFLWLGLLEAFTKKRFFLIGLLIGGAYLSRLPVILACVFPFIFYFEKFITIKMKTISINLNTIILFALGILPAVLVDWTYNYIRFGTIQDITYNLLPVFHEPWYRYGLFSVNYIPVHLAEIFTAMPTFVKGFPYVIPSQYVMALEFVTPALFLIFFANFKTRLALSSVVTIIIMSMPSLLHGSNGFSQFGYRFALDYFPFFLILIGMGLERKFTWWAKLLILLSIVINAWGVFMIYFLNIWTM